MFRHAFFLKGRPDLLNKIVRNFKKTGKQIFVCNDADAVDMGLLQKVYSSLERIRTEQLKLESMVDVLEHKTEQIDLYTQNVFDSFYQR